jgi:hypothetical protein
LQGTITIFIALFVKSHRIFLIFCNQRLRKSLIQRLHLTRLVLGLAAVPIAYLSVWTALDPSSTTPTVTEQKRERDRRDPPLLALTLAFACVCFLFVCRPQRPTSLLF